MCATPDVVMREFGKTLEAQRYLATEQEIKNAFASAGYGIKKCQKWFDDYRRINFIVAVREYGLMLKNENGEQLYTSPKYWPVPSVVE